MKFLHTADLHLGRRLNDIPLLEDQKSILKQIVDIAVAESVDAVIIAGDVYDKSVPGADAMSAFDAFLNSLVSHDVKVFMISGNHDSSERISYLSGIISIAGIYANEMFDGKLQTVTLNDDYGKINIHLLPYIRPLQTRRYYSEEEILTYEDAVKTVLENSNINKEDRNILVSHQFITGGVISDSEEFAVGGLDNISGDLFDDFDYVALGHLHRSQKTGRESMRYSGSPMKYSISEADHNKSVTIIEFADKRTDLKIDTVPVTPPHDVREVKGTLETIMSMEYSEDYIRVILTDEIVPPDARVTVSTVFPNLIALGVMNSRTHGSEDFTVGDDIKNKSKMDLFLDFFKVVNNGAESSDEQAAIMKSVLEELEEENHETN